MLSGCQAEVLLENRLSNRYYSHMTCSSFGLCRKPGLAHTNHEAWIALTVSMFIFRKGFSCKSVLLVMKWIMPIAGLL